MHQDFKSNSSELQKGAGKALMQVTAAVDALSDSFMQSVASIMNSYSRCYILTDSGYENKFHTIVVGDHFWWKLIIYSANISFMPKCVLVKVHQSLVCLMKLQ